MLRPITPLFINSWLVFDIAWYCASRDDLCYEAGHVMSRSRILDRSDVIWLVTLWNDGWCLYTLVVIIQSHNVIYERKKLDGNVTPEKARCVARNMGGLFHMPFFRSSAIFSANMSILVSVRIPTPVSAVKILTHCGLRCRPWNMISCSSVILYN